MSAFDSSHFISITNRSLENLVFVLYKLEDKFQVQGSHKFPISSSGTHIQRFDSETGYALHIFRHGIMGLISPRTRLSSGYGFPVATSANYYVNITDKDDLGNLISLEQELEGGGYERIQSTIYYFGDMIIKPALNSIAAGGVPFLRGLDSNMYRDWRNKQISYGAYNEEVEGIYANESNEEEAGRICASTTNERASQEPSSISLPPIPCSHGERDDASSCESNRESIVPEERELWGVFFQQIYLAGAWALREEIITQDDVEGQEAFLFIGLPAVSLCNVVLRSIAANSTLDSNSNGSQSSSMSLVLVDGRRVYEDTCPDGFKGMFALLFKTILALTDLPPLSEVEMRWVREFILVAGSARRITGITNYITFYFIFCVYDICHLCIAHN